MSETCAFELDSDLSLSEIRLGLDRLLLPTDVIEIAAEDVQRADIVESKRFSVGVPIYMYEGPPQDFLAALLGLAEYLLSISHGEVYYFRNDVAEQYDESNTIAITVDDIKSLPPDVSQDGYHTRYLIRSDVST